MNKDNNKGENLFKILKGVLVAGICLFAGEVGYFSGKNANANKQTSPDIPISEVAKLKAEKKEQLENYLEDRFGLADINSYSIDILDGQGDKHIIADGVGGYGTIKIFYSEKNEKGIEEFKNLYVDVSKPVANKLAQLIAVCADGASKSKKEYKSDLIRFYQNFESALESNTAKKDNSVTIETVGSKPMFEASLKENIFKSQPVWSVSPKVDEMTNEKLNEVVINNINNLEIVNVSPVASDNSGDYGFFVYFLDENKIERAFFSISMEKDAIQSTTDVYSTFVSQNNLNNNFDSNFIPQTDGMQYLSEDGNYYYVEKELNTSSALYPYMGFKEFKDNEINNGPQK